MFNKKKKNVRIILNETPFVIYQMIYPTKLNSEGEVYVKSKAASPIFGSQVPDRIAFYDNQGKKDVDYGYDFVRKEEDKHLSEDDIIEKFGSKYHEFQILSAEQIREIAGEPTKSDENEKTIFEPAQRKVKERKKQDSFITTIDELKVDETIQMPREADIESENETFVIKPQESTYEYNTMDEEMPKPKATTIPNFLKEEEKPVFTTSEPEFTFGDSSDDEVSEPTLDDLFADTNEEEESEPFEFQDPTTEYEDKEEDEISFDNIPSMSAPKVEFQVETHNNAPIDRNISIEEAMRRAQNNEFPDLMTGEVGSNRPGNVKTVVVKSEAPKPEPKPVAKPEVKKPVVEEVTGPNDYSHYNVPWQKFFEKSKSGNDSHPAWLEEKKQVINDTLSAFGIKGEVIDYTKGPAFTLYEIMLDPGVNVKKVSSIRDNLAMNLQVKSLRILAPIPGKNTVGVEAPNDKADSVAFGDLLSDEYMHDNKPLKVAMGKLIDNTVVYQDIASMPHALIAGATQSGKSVSINTMLVSLITKNSPADLKLIIVDPKMVEFTLYDSIPHLATPIITDSVLATEALKWSVEEMERRYLDLAHAKVKNIGDYNQKRKMDKTLKPMPFIVIVVDEFNDLVMTSGQEVQDYIVRLAQKARACGIHIILATQRPTTNVVNGTIKANIPCRIAFRVASQMDSMVILDQPGADELLGRGDMLIVNNSAPQRAQGAYLADSEIEAVCNYLTSNYQPDYIFSTDDLKKKISSGQSSVQAAGKELAQESDDMLYNVARYCIESEGCSINGIQNQFGVGFNRASRIVTLLEEREIVSPKNGTKPREIMVTFQDLDEMFGKESATDIDLEANAE